MPAPAPEPPDFPASQLFLRRLAHSLVHDAAQAEDLVQDTWAAWLERGPRGLSEPRAWLARVLRNRAFNARRGEARRAQRELQHASDAGPPETEGTLEAQARLIEALRGLDEPYRSTLVQRYYHDLAPSAIAERTGTPLNTVKARLARGLERLRAELDRRYGGDRGAWCHWLAVLGGPRAGSRPGIPPPIKGTASKASAGSASLGGWLFFAGALASLLGWVVWHTTRYEAAEPTPSTEVQVARAAVELREPRREPAPALREREKAGEPPAVPVPPAVDPPRPVPPPLPFEWQELAGTPSHDNFSAFRKRTDLILRPRVLATHAGLSGQPTISGLDLYSGGATLYRVDLSKGAVHVPGEDFGELLRAAAGKGVLDEARWRGGYAGQGLVELARVAAAPAITSDSVLARLVGDGSVVALDRDLGFVRWSWMPSDPGPCPLSGSLIGDKYLAAHRREVVALSAINGGVDWRFQTGEADEVVVVPATDGDLVYFATERGVVIAVDLARGKEEWRHETGRSFGGTLPVALADRVLFADGGEVREGGSSGWRHGDYGELRALQSYDGRELWKVSVISGLDPGLGEGRVFVPEAWDLTARSTETGALLNRHSGDVSRGSREEYAGAVTQVGGSLYFIRGGLHVVELATNVLRWSFQPLQDGRVLDFVHSGDRVYVALTSGLACLGDDPEAGPAPPGFVLTAEGKGSVSEPTRRPRRR